MSARILPAALLPLALLLVPGPARADVLELDDGRLVEGLVVEEGEREVVLLSRFGETHVPRASIRSRDPAPPLDEQIRSYLAALAPDDIYGQVRLAQGLVRVGREEEGRATAEAVLERDPENALAHELLGHVRHQGVWRTPDEARRAEGLEKHGEEWYTPEEWANVSAAVREKAVEAERRAEVERLQAEVGRAVRLMMGPDPGLRARGRGRLEALALQFDNPSLLDLARHVDAYVQALDEAARKAASVDAPGGVAGGYVLGEIRATLSRLKRPITTFETSLASNVGSAPVRIQLPELEVIRVRTTMLMPADSR